MRHGLKEVVIQKVRLLKMEGGTADPASGDQCTCGMEIFARPVPGCRRRRSSWVVGHILKNRFFSPKPFLKNGFDNRAV